MEREKVKAELDEIVEQCRGMDYIGFSTITEHCQNILALLKEQDERLRKLQKDKDKLCLEVSEWKHKFHDAPPKFVSQGVVDQICWERDTALSQLEQIGKGLGSKMDDIVALLNEQYEEHRRLLSWLGKFCRHIDNGDAWLTDEENIAFFKEKMKQQFGWNTD